MDAALALERLIGEFTDLLEVRDFKGAELTLETALVEAPEYAAFVHLRFGRLYREWNKLSSAVDHLYRASETPNLDPLLRIQIVEEFRIVRNKQAGERP